MSSSLGRASLLARELTDPQRFANSPQVANYFGLCPSESTSDERRRLGSITKYGNPRLRRLTVEVARGFSRFQQDTGECAAGEHCSLVGKPRRPPRKKAIVAPARELVVELWRMASWRARAEELGLVQKVRLN